MGAIFDPGESLQDELPDDSGPSKPDPLDLPDPSKTLLSPPAAVPPPPAATPPAPVHSKRLDFLAQVRLCGDCRDKEYRKQHIEECKECREQAQSVQLLKPRPLSDKEILQAGLTGKFAAAHADEDADEDEDEWDD